MIYDATAWLGHWPFRSLPRRSAGDLLRQMDKHDIDKALVGSLHGLFYKDVHEANHELTKEIRRHRDRLFPCATINPRYGGWQDDLKQCSDDFGMPVLRMVPDYHDYSLSDVCAQQLVAQAHALDMKPAFFGRIVDPRGRHRLDPGREIDQPALATLLQKAGEISCLMLNFSGIPSGEPFGQALCCYDITRLLGRNGLRLEVEIKKYGAERFLFGTTMLLRYGKPVCLALEKCELANHEREAIQWRNLAKLVPAMGE